MRIRHLWFVVAILLVPSVASADGHRAGLFGGGSVARGSTLKGVHFNYEHAVGDPAKQHVYVMADYSIHASKRNTLMGGANLTGQVGRLSFSLRALAGGVWGDGSSNLAGSIGAAVELGQPYKVSNANTRWALRVLVDEIIRGGDAKNFWRASVGVVVKFPTRP